MAESEGGRQASSCGWQLSSRTRRDLKVMLRVEKADGFDCALTLGMSLVAYVTTEVGRRTRRLELMQNTRVGDCTDYAGQGFLGVLEVICKACYTLLGRVVTVTNEGSTMKVITLLVTLYCLISSIGTSFADDASILALKRADYTSRLIRVHQSYIQELEIAMRNFAHRADSTSINMLRAIQQELEAVRKEIVTLQEHGTSSLTILYATYGSLTQYRYVTDSVAAMVADNRLEIPSGFGRMNDLFGDPHPGVRKTLTVEYRIGAGGPRRAQAREGDSLLIIAR